ncbi:small acid-soluble spore protein F (minor alpha/beta-type SASP) [Halobacillus alkaliphilus]|uniref:Small acid-soluble spore protein F (Minor alpha/beta-type SASP) n=1 Tax=Halobacillus alkaliphilus TaxID=396056 RepID=A0A1I2RHD0_9BACI|nr:small, acid-soluble spore protein, alpha/beta type [Halobacillus alkaliphilus]SFG37251.1 small acid-soluble spore protein F (minor alpha/beta-type SASP) [Halobacillus alkaliphilus]
MGRRRGMMSDSFKEEIAKELGFYDKVQKDGWGGITTREAGNMVKRAIEKAQEQMIREQQK